MFVLPVIDLQDGVAVHGLAGRRETYRPVQASALADRPALPLQLARGARDRLGIGQVYLADLDAIAGRPPNWYVLRQLTNLDISVWADVGLTTSATARDLPSRSDIAVQWIVALESLESPRELQWMLDHIGAGQVVVSLDLCDGRPITPWHGWQPMTAVDVARDLIRIGVSRLIVLDLARVGMRQGTGTRTLVRQLRRQTESLQIVVGGGISNLDEVRTLADDGADGVLLATCLHDGTLGRSEIERIETL